MTFRPTIMLLAVLALRAERLPLKHFGVAEGLPSDSVHRIFRDSRGYIWLCTSDGLAFFDGYQVHTVKELAAGANDIVEAKDHSFWLATRDGIVHYTPGGAARLFVPGVKPFEHFVKTVRLDSRGVLWAGTMGGLFRLDLEHNLTRVDLARPDAHESIWAILENRAGEIWAGGLGGLACVRQPLRVKSGAMDSRLPTLALSEAPDGKIWIGTNDGACLFDPVHGKPDTCLTSADGIPGRDVQSFLATRDGDLWAGTLNGLAHITRDHEKVSVSSFGIQEGLSNVMIETLAEDSSGDIWIGTDGGGAMRLARSGFVSFGKDEGLSQVSLALATPTTSSGISVIGRIGENLTISQIAGRRFSTTRLGLRAGPGWGQTAVQETDGSWWLGTAEGAAHYTNNRIEFPSGWPRDQSFRLFRDSTGRLWMSTTSQLGRLLVSDASHTSVTELTQVPGHADSSRDFVSSFAEDGNGDIWIGFIEGGVSRYHKGVITTFSGPDAPFGGVRWLHFNPPKIMWVATSRRGLCRIDTDRESTFHCYGVQNGLSSNLILSVVADLRGRIYATSGKGVDRLDPANGAIQHYSTADGLIPGEIQMSARDGSGNLWFGSSAGISRFTPTEGRPDIPPVVLVRGFSVNGSPVPLPETGDVSLGPLNLAAGQNQLQIDFSAAGSGMLYSFRLSNEDTWSTPSPERSVRYAQLTPGNYQFRVRAVNHAGVISQLPAEAIFSIAAPVWQRWWFRMGALLALLTLTYGTYRYRVTRLMELEHIRLGIARDLHDDIGTSLSQIALLSEVLIRRVDGDRQLQGPLEQIGTVSRELVDSMSDLVWSVNPKRDTLGDLTQRMRVFAAASLSARNIAFEFVSPSGEDHLKLIDVRRQVFLIFKESINNTARHSRCSKVEIVFTVDKEWLILQVRDDGCGFDCHATVEGNGIASMRNRAYSLGGDLHIASSPQGTTLSLRVPVAPKIPLRKRTYIDKWDKNETFTAMLRKTRR